MTGSRLFKIRWLAAAGIAVLAGIVGVALMLQNGGSAACAAPPSSTVKKGVATYFFLEGTLGSCSYPSPPGDDLYVALGFTQYATAAACGTYIDVTGPKGKVRVKVIDSCPKCPVGHLDLSLTAFKKIADKEDGLVNISYRAVPGPAGPLSVRVKEGSSQYWLSLLVDNHAGRLTSVQVAGPGGSFRSAQREEWNYWTLPSGAGRGPFRVKVTDAEGRTVTLPGIKLAVGKTQRAGAPLGGVPAEKVDPPAKPKAKKKPSLTPSPTKSSPVPAVSSAAPKLRTKATTESSTATAVDLTAARSHC